MSGLFSPKRFFLILLFQFELSIPTLILSLYIQMYLDNVDVLPIPIYGLNWEICEWKVGNERKYGCIIKIL